MISPIQKLARSLVLGSILLAALTSSGFAQSSGRYELLNQGEVASKLMEQPVTKLQPGAQSTGTQSPTNIFVSSPLPAAVLLKRYDILVRAPSVALSHLRFETGDSRLTPDSARSLDKLAGAIHQILRQSPGEVFLIEGHTDATGNSQGNLRLSESRARAVSSYLVNVHAVPERNLLIHGFGDTHLLVRTSRAEVANRRVEVRRVTPLILAEVPLIRELAKPATEKPLDCGTVSGGRSITLVMRGFASTEANRVRGLWSHLPAVADHELLEASGGLYRYRLSLTSTGCRIIEQLEAEHASAGIDVDQSVSVALVGSVVTISKN